MTIDQTNASNKALVGQGFTSGSASDAEASVEQRGNRGQVNAYQGADGSSTGDEITISQIGTQNTAVAAQGAQGTSTSLNNTASIEQSGGESGQVIIYQGMGIFGADVASSATHNTATVDQSGSSQASPSTGYVFQGAGGTATDNHATILQINETEGNRAAISQGGINASALLGGSLSVFGTGISTNSDAMITQRSDGDTASINQSGDTNFAMVTQDQ